MVATGRQTIILKHEDLKELVHPDLATKLKTNPTGTDRIKKLRADVKKWKKKAAEAKRLAHV